MQRLIGSPLFDPLAVAGYCTFLFLLSSGPTPVDSGEPLAQMDKLVHFLLYAPLGVLFYRLLNRAGASSGGWRTLAAAVILTTLYGISDEVHQYFVPCRSARLADVAADFAGAAVGVFFYDLLWVRRPDALRKIPGLTNLRDFFKKQGIEISR